MRFVWSGARVLVFGLVLLLCGHGWLRSVGQAAGERVAGRVLSARDGRAIAGASLTLAETRGGRIVATARADGEGRFRFDPLTPGKYALRASAAGFLDAGYQEHEQFSTAIVVGKGFAVEALEMRLVASAMIRGRVTEASGDPVPRAALALYEIRAEPVVAEEETGAAGAGRVRRGPSTMAGEDGGFEFEAVAPGRYYLSASGTPWYAVHARREAEGAQHPYRAEVDPALDVAYPEVFFPHAVVPEEATPLVIAAGEAVRADFVMQPQRAVSLTFRLPGQEGQGLRQMPQVPQLTRSVFGVTEFVQTQMSGGQNEMSFVGLAPGRYSLKMRGNRGSVQDAGSVNLSAGPVTMDAAALPASEGSATVHISVRGADGAVVPAQTRVFLRAVTAGGGLRGNVPAVLVSEKGEAEFPEMAAGEYRVEMFRAGRSVEVASLTVDGKAVADRRLRLAAGGSPKVEMVAGAPAVAVEGFARREGKPEAGSMVVLVPAGARAEAGQFRRDQSDLDGSFTLPNVLPGNYILVAIEDGWTLRWQDAAAMQKYLVQGTPVTVPSGGAGRFVVPESVAVQGR